VEHTLRRILGLAVVIVAVAACYAAPAAQSVPSGGFGGLGRAALPAGAQLLGVDADTGDCVGPASSRFAVITIARGEDFQSLFPGADRTPELAGIAQLQVVVYKAGWPGPLLLPVGAPERSPKANSWDVCVRRSDGDSIQGLPIIVYGDVSRADSPLSSP
jgi:hypothetical protein